MVIRNFLNSINFTSLQCNFLYVYKDEIYRLLRNSFLKYAMMQFPFWFYIQKLVACVSDGVILIKIWLKNTKNHFFLFSLRQSFFKFDMNSTSFCELDKRYTRFISPTLFKTRTPFFGELRKLNSRLYKG